jgi:hypothetical protein
MKSCSPISLVGDRETCSFLAISRADETDAAVGSSGDVQLDTFLLFITTFFAYGSLHGITVLLFLFS